jgi:hypothetical protein
VKGGISSFHPGWDMGIEEQVVLSQEEQRCILMWNFWLFNKFDDSYFVSNAILMQNFWLLFIQ